ncbi:hypothetical protein [Pandoraea eparura]|nr:hypothetical protein [Pandoraea eparura]
MTNKLWSMRERLEIRDENDVIVYVLESRHSWFAPAKWMIFRGDEEVGTFRHKLFSWVPTWHVSGALGEFKFKQKVFSSKHHIYVEDGPLPGAVVTGNFWGTQFSVTDGDRALARAQAHVMTIRNKVSIEILGEPELFVVFAMFIVQLIRFEKKSSSSTTSGTGRYT